MVTIEVRYRGDLRTEAAHGPSGATLITDAPVDNHGLGRSFSPTDLVATALGTCMLTVMGIAARTRGWDFAGARATVEKEMAQQPVRRIGRLGVTLHLPGEFTTDQRKFLEAAALTCPVHKSLHPDVQIPIRFEWGDGAG